MGGHGMSFRAGSGNGAHLNRIAEKMQVHGPRIFGNAAFAEAASKAEGPPLRPARAFALSFRDGPKDQTRNLEISGFDAAHRPDGGSDQLHPPLFGLMRNFSPVARLA